MQPQWILVKVHPRATKDVLVRMGADRFEAWVRAKPVEGEANRAVVNLLVSQLGVPRSAIRLVKGAMRSHKVFQVRTS